MSIRIVLFFAVVSIISACSYEFSNNTYEALEKTQEPSVNQNQQTNGVVSCYVVDIRGIGVKESCIEVPNSDRLLAETLKSECRSLGYGGGDLGTGCGSGYSIRCDLDDFVVYGYSFGQSCSGFYDYDYYDDYYDDYYNDDYYYGDDYW